MQSPRARKAASLQRGLSELTGPGEAKLAAAGVAMGSGESRKYSTSKPAGPEILKPAVGGGGNQVGLAAVNLIVSYPLCR
jgi:hypothetical protein